MIETFDVIIIGTGLKETILSSSLSHSGKKVLQLDSSKHYGEQFQTLKPSELFSLNKSTKSTRDYPHDDTFVLFHPKNTFDDFQWTFHRKRLNETVDSVMNDILKKNNQYSIDLRPSFLLSCDKLIDLLKKSSIEKYLKFKSVDATYFQLDDRTENVPSSKADIFSSTLLSLTEKTILFKFIKNVISFNENNTIQSVDGNSFDFSSSKSHSLDQTDILYDQYLESQKLNFFLKKIVLSITSLVNNESSLRSSYGLLSTQRFSYLPITIPVNQRYLKSIGVYGPTAFIVPMYGISDIVQAFARSSAVFGSVFMLDCRPKGFQLNISNNTKRVLLENGDVYECYSLILSPYFLSNEENYTKIARALFILEGSLVFSRDSLEEPQCQKTFSLVVPSNCIVTIEDKKIQILNTIIIYQLGDQTKACPSDQSLVYMMGSSPNIESSHQDMKHLSKYYFDYSETENKTKPLLLYSCYYTETVLTSSIKSSNSTSEMKFEKANGVQNSSNVFSFSSIGKEQWLDDCIDEVESVFTTICPDQHFFPPIKCEDDDEL